LASPNLFAYTLANSFLGEAAIHFGLTGPALVLNEAGVRPLAALRWALAALADGQCQAALAGFCELPPDDLERGGALFVFLSLEGAASLPLLSLCEKGFFLNQNAITSWSEMFRLLPRLEGVEQ